MTTEQLSIEELITRMNPTEADLREFTEVTVRQQANSLVLLQNIILQRENIEMKKELAQLNGHSGED